MTATSLKIKAVVNQFEELDQKLGNNRKRTWGCYLISLHNSIPNYQWVCLPPKETNNQLTEFIYILYLYLYPTS
jgi:hypothetical protein